LELCPPFAFVEIQPLLEFEYRWIFQGSIAVGGQIAVVFLFHFGNGRKSGISREIICVKAEIEQFAYRHPEVDAALVAEYGALLRYVALPYVAQAGRYAHIHVFEFEIGAGI